MQNNTKIRALTEGAVMVALAWALSYLKIRLWFQGGSVDLVMIPLIVYAVRWGSVWGMGAGLVFGTLKFFLAGGVAIGWQSIVFDYTVAYMVVGLAGLARGKKWQFVTGTVIGCVARFIVHYISGVTIYAEWMPETFMGMTMTSPAIYSALYNGAYMLPNMLIAAAVLAVLGNRINALMPVPAKDKA